MGLFSNWSVQNEKNPQGRYGGYSREEFGKLIYQADHGDERAYDIVAGLCDKHKIDYKEVNRIRKDVYLPLAMGGDTDAQYWMGMANGDRRLDSIEWFSKAAQGGNVEAMKAIGRRYSKEYNECDKVPSYGYNPDREMYWYHKAAYAGDPEAMYDIAMTYVIGDELPRDREKAFEWYQKAAELHYDKAYLMLGEFYVSPIDGRYDPMIALRYFEKAAESRDADLIAEASIKMARIYGDCYRLNYRPDAYANANMALYWLFQAFELGDDECSDTARQYIHKVCNGAGIALPSQDIQRKWMREARDRVR